MLDLDPPSQGEFSLAVEAALIIKEITSCLSHLLRRQETKDCKYSIH
ncbi:hypothetical protein KHA80_20745 [Anaerobacillus sp. HL2]|nr:hypothetical protein KHA80_20745 [Anaerobacillus sp. HL2]